jgi:hypothetical protein
VIGVFLSDVSNAGQKISAMTAMITTIRTLATRVASHAGPGRTVSMLVLMDRPFVTGSESRLEVRPRRRGGPRHLAVVTFITQLQMGARGAGTRIEGMSDHTERLRKLRDRIVAAKEFL